MKAPYTPVILSNNPCIHGLIENWCALCKQKAGDKHANSMIKAFSPKSPRRYKPEKTTSSTPHN